MLPDHLDDFSSDFGIDPDQLQIKRHDTIDDLVALSEERGLLGVVMSEDYRKLATEPGALQILENRLREKSPETQEAFKGIGERMINWIVVWAGVLIYFPFLLSAVAVTLVTLVVPGRFVYPFPDATFAWSSVAHFSALFFLVFQGATTVEINNPNRAHNVSVPVTAVFIVFDVMSLTFGRRYYYVGVVVMALAMVDIPVGLAGAGLLATAFWAPGARRKAQYGAAAVVALTVYWFSLTNWVVEMAWEAVGRRFFNLVTFGRMLQYFFDESGAYYDRLMIAIATVNFCVLLFGVLASYANGVVRWPKFFAAFGSWAKEWVMTYCVLTYGLTTTVAVNFISVVLEKAVVLLRRAAVGQPIHLVWVPRLAYNQPGDNGVALLRTFNDAYNRNNAHNGNNAVAGGGLPMHAANAPPVANAVPVVANP